ncbi:MAG TPA: terminase family protein [Gemmataceae bacterium]|nr:terminase family protein [Gemmataceae bacterium]
MDARTAFALALDPARLLRARGLTPDPWQREFLLAPDRQVLLNCSRQSGKSTVVAALALHNLLFKAKSLVLLLSPSLRQSVEIFRKVIDGFDAMGRPLRAVRRTALQLELANGSRVVSLPGREHTLRSFSGVNLLVLDEAARIPDVLYRSVRPMLAVSRGRLVALSTPFGQRGWFFEEWQGRGPWKKVRISWRDCPRIAADFIAEECRALGESWVRQEYECEFTALEGLVYPDFEQALTVEWPNPQGKQVGGIDFGWRNPFAAVWGVLDRDDVLWIGQERYGREIPLHEHAAALPRKVIWFADPAGRTEIEELRVANLVVRSGFNDIRLGIAAVSARLRTGRLRIHATACPNLVQEALLYRYPSTSERAHHGELGENPIDDHNHALGALRYLIAGLDERYVARLRGTSAKLQAASAKAQTNHNSPNNPDLWTPLS